MPKPPPTRRTLLTAAALPFATTEAQAQPAAPGLREAAPTSGLLYGCATEASQLAANPALAQAVARECAILVPEGSMKWRALRPAPDRFDFRGGDALLNFASEHGQRVRGHTLVWHQALPDWFATTATQANAAGLLGAHIEQVCGHYAGRMQAWDVVNEVVDPRVRGLRETPWLRLLGESYIATAFRAARAADPAALLFLNEYGLEPDGGPTETKRRLVLALLRRLREAGVPIQGLGLQSHLIAGDRFDSLVPFLEQVRVLGLRVAITELDVSDVHLPGEPLQARDAAVAATYAAYLQKALSVPGLVHEILTWGLTDATSWLQGYRPRPDGRPTRPLPLDAAMARKPAWSALAAALKIAEASNPPP